MQDRSQSSGVNPCYSDLCVVQGKALSLQARVEFSMSE